MASSPATPSSARKLSDVARRLVVPKGATKTGWPDIEATCRRLGTAFDRWQADAGRAIFSKTPDGKYATTVGGCGMSLPRQVGKTHLIGYAMFALCVLHPGLTVIWTAHHSRTANETLLAMQSMAMRERVAPHVRAVTTGNGDEAVRFHNGSRILFGAREHGFGRGFAGVDVLIFDEGQILPEKSLDAMLPTMNAAPNPLFILMGTPPTPDVVASGKAEVFTRMRTDATSGEADDVVWIECGAEPDADLDDREQWARANPSFPHRTPATSMLRLRKKLSPDSWLREGLGIWEIATGGLAFGPGKWEACAGPEPEGVSLLAIGVAVSMDLTRAAIVGAGVDKDGVTHVRPLQHGPGTGWVVGRAAEVQGAHSVPVVIDGRGPGAVLIPELERVLGAHLTVATTPNVLDACAGIFGRVQEQELRHGAYPELDAAVAAAKHREVQDRWAWGRKASTADISTLEAATLADWAANGQDTTSVYETRGLVTL